MAHTACEFASDPSSWQPKHAISVSGGGRKPITYLAHIFIVCLILSVAAFPLSAQVEINRQIGFAADKMYQFGDVDSINMFNGMLHAQIPIGQKYVVSQRLSYQFGLVYLGNPWTFDLRYYNDGVESSYIQYALPSTISNAGAGWYFSLGELLQPYAPFNGSGNWIFIGADGARHKFDGACLSSSDSTCYTTTDMSYLRMRTLPNTNDVHEIDFSNGVTYRFEDQGSDPKNPRPIRRIVEMRDTFSSGNPGSATTNFVHIQYNTLVNTQYGNGDTWEITDSARRDHKIYFSPAVDDNVNYAQLYNTETIPVPHPRNVLTEADLAGFASSYDVYRFNYGGGTGYNDTLIARDASHDSDDLTDTMAHVSLLTSVVLPQTDLSQTESWSMAYQLNSSGEDSGALSSITLPTGGTIAYTYTRRRFQKSADQTDFVRLKDGGIPGDHRTDNLAVATRTLTDPVEANDSETCISKNSGTWTYESEPTPLLVPEECPANSGKPCPERELWVKVLDPAGNTTQHFFSICADIYHQTLGWFEPEYGYPLTHDAHGLPTYTDGTGLSTITTDPSGAILRYTYAAYGANGVAWSNDQQVQDGNISLRRSIMGYRYMVNGSQVDDLVDTQYTNYDGYGHYRQAATTSTLFDPDTSAADQTARTTFTSYNGTSGSTPTIAPGNPWLLNTYTEQGVTSTLADGTTEVRKSLFQFEPDTAFLSSRRILKGDSAGPHDLLAVFSRDAAGNTTREDYYGGDTQDVTTTPATPAYSIAHEYLDGSLKKSYYVDPSSRSSLVVYDATLDESTDLPSSSRDAAGLATTYDYFAMGRLKRILPPPGDDSINAATNIEYHPQGPQVSAVLTRGDTRKTYVFDGFGRVFQEKTTAPVDGVPTELIQETDYNILGWKTKAYERETTPTHFTCFSGFDPFGRATLITSPDGSQTTLTFKGISQTTRTTMNVAMTGGNTAATTVETADAFGRLRKVDEQPGPPTGPLISTSYAYDGADHLIRVSMTDHTQAAPVSQTRSFQYDQRGFLISEKHPEKSAKGSGATIYDNGATDPVGYDARGHLLYKREDLASTKYANVFQYDFAERLIGVNEYDASAHAQGRSVKEYHYDQINDQGHAATGPGRLLKTVRHNYSALGDVPVTDYFQYDAAGRMSSKETDVNGASFVQPFTYTSLNAPDSITYPSCGSCGSATLPTAIPLNYTNGLLTGVTGYAGITYSPSGMVHQVAHVDASGATTVTDTIAPDPSGMPRPASIAFTGYWSCSDVTITMEPADSYKVAGSTAPLSVTVQSARAVTYQWYQGGSGDISNPIDKATSSQFTTPVLQTSTQYWVRISTDTCSVDSTTATVHICATPQIVLAPVPQTVSVPPAGQSVTVSATVVASGDELTYAWYAGPQPAAGTTPDPKTAIGHQPTLSVTYGPTDVGSHQYWVDISNTTTSLPSECMGDVRSSVTFTVTSDLVLYNVSGNQTVFQNGNMEPVYVSVLGDGHITFAWYHGIGGASAPLGPGTSSTTGNATIGTLTTSMLTTSLIGQYDAFWCVVTNGSVSLTSPRIYVSKYESCPLPPVTVSPPSVVLQPATQATLTAACDWPRVTYQWYTGTSGDTRNKVPGATTNALTVGLPVQNYWCRVTSECGTTWEDSATIPVSVAATSEVCGPAEILRQPQSVDIAEGQPATLSVDANDPNSTLTYTWFKGSVTPPPFATGVTQITDSPSLTTNYYVQIDGCNGAYSYTLPATVHVRSCSDITINAQPPSPPPITPGEAATLQINATSAETINYQWYAGDNGDTSIPVGSNTASIVVTPSVTTQYWVRLSAGSCTIDSFSATVEVCHPAAFVHPPAGGDIQQGQGFLLTATASGTNLQYVWREGTPSSPGPVVGTVDTLWIRPLNADTYYLTVKADCGDAITSDPITVTVCVPPSITTQPQPVTIFSGDTAILSVQATEGTNTPLRYAWVDSGANPQPNNTSATFTTPPLTQATQYYVQVTAGACSITSQPVTVSICPLSKVVGAGGTFNIASGQNLTLTALISPATGSAVTWYAGHSGDYANSTAVTGQLNSNSTTVNPTTSTTYWAQVVNGGCTSVTPDFVVNVSIPTFTQQPSAIMINGGQQAELRVAVDVAGSTFQWYIGAPGDISNPISGATSATYLTPALSTTTTYWVRATGPTGLSTDSAAATITICQPPSITSVTSGVPIALGSSVTLNCVASGTGLTYQWYIGSAHDTTNPINGATASSYTDTPQNTISYWVRVTGACGTQDGPTSTISVCATPTITTQPVGSTIYNGQTATLTVVASDATTTPLAYQWYAGTSGDTSAPITGATFSTFTTPELTANASYWVQVADGIACTPASSATATISVCTYAQAIQSPGDSYSTVGQSVTMTGLTNNGTNQYQWYQGASGDTSHVISAWTSANSVTVAPTATTSYWYQLQNGSCVSNSATATVYVCVPQITQQPSGTTINSGQTATLTVAANTAGVTYQWYIGTSGTTTSPISGATGSSYTTPALTSATSYWARATSTCGRTVDSATATVSICQAPAATMNTASQWISRGNSVTLQATGTGTNITYQWYSGNSGDTSSPITGATSASYAASPQNTTTYWVKVSGMCGSANSTAVTISVCATPTITTQPAGPTIYNGATATISVVASEATTTPMTYQWYAGTSGNTSSPISGATSASYTTPALTANASYWAQVSNGTCTPVNSATATVSVCAYAQTISGPANVNSSVGQSVTLTGAINNGTNTYQWYQGASGDTSHVIATWSSTNSVTVAPTVTTSYWYQLQNGSCTSNSTAGTVNVCVPQATQQPSSVTIASGTSTTLTFVANTAGVTYQWYIGTSGTTTSPISGATGSSYTTPALTSTTSYWARATSTCSRTVDSATATVSMCQAPAATMNTGSQWIARGNSVTLQATGSGTNITYQWYIGNSGDTTSPINGATSSSYTATPQNTTTYWVKVSGMCGSANSTAVTISVCAQPTINTQPASPTIYNGQSATLTVGASDVTTTAVGYQWYIGNSGDTTNPISGATSATYTTPALTANTNYWVRVSNGTCATTDSATAVVTVCAYTVVVGSANTIYTSPGQTARVYSPVTGTQYTFYQGTSGDTSHVLQVWNNNYWDVAPTVTTQYWNQVTNGVCTANSATTTVNVCVPQATQQPSGTTIVSGNTATMTFVANTAGITYQWYIGTSGTTTSPISGATGSSYTTPALTSTTNYWARATSMCGRTVDSATVTVTVCTLPAITTQPANAAAVYINSSSHLSVTASGASLSYQWYKGSSGDTSHPVSGATAATMTITVNNTDYYWVRVTNTCGSVNSNAALISVYPQISAQPAGASLTSGSTGTLQIGVGSENYLHYQWYYSTGTAIPGAADSALTFTPSLTTDTSVYCVVTSGTATSYSNTATFSMCTGVDIWGTSVSSTGGNCRQLSVSTDGSSYAWYQGARGDTSHLLSYASSVNVCPTTTTTYWVRVYGTDPNTGNNCYADSAAVTAP